jgi:hypothetical protein
MPRQKIKHFGGCVPTFSMINMPPRGIRNCRTFPRLLRVSLESGVQMEILIELSQEDLDLIAGGQGDASWTVTQSAAGPTSATNTSTVTQTTSYSITMGASSSQMGSATSHSG